jgi:divalent metal cation (Fe/Co/Zn/Cd) transporter
MRPRDSVESDSIRHALSLRPSPFGHHNPSDSGTSTPHHHRRGSERDNLRRAETLPVGVHPGSSDSHHGERGINSFPLAPLSPLGHAASAPLGSNAVGPSSGDSTGDAHSTALEPDAGAGDAVERHVKREDDVERGDHKLGLYNDPYQLSSGLKSEQEIDSIKANSGRKRGGCAPIASGKSASTTHKLRNFYKDQNENIERLLKPVDAHRQEAKDTYGDNELRYKIAVHGSFIANVLLAGLQVYGAASSGSLSLFTTMADALFDPLSNLSLILSHRAVNRVDSRRFPSGKARIETAANIAFCFIMTAVSLIIIVQSIQELIKGSDTRTEKFHLASIIAVAVAFTVKLGLFSYCFAIRNMYSQVRILWEDHRNDLIINGTGLMFSLLGSHVRWWIDPAGAIVISFLIMFLWLRTAHSEFLLLIGVTAEPSMLSHITYICKFDHYHLGELPLT